MPQATLNQATGSSLCYMGGLAPGGSFHRDMLSGGELVTVVYPLRWSIPSSCRGAPADTVAERRLVAVGSRFGNKPKLEESEHSLEEDPGS